MVWGLSLAWWVQWVIVVKVGCFCFLRGGVSRPRGPASSPCGHAFLVPNLFGIGSVGLLSPKNNLKKTLECNIVGPCNALIYHYCIRCTPTTLNYLTIPPTS